MIKFTVMFLFCILAANTSYAEITGTVPVKGVSKKDYPTLVTTTIEDVIKQIKNVHSGFIKEVELETKDGFLVYEASLIDQGKKSKIYVDAGTGKILLDKVSERKIYPEILKR